MENQDIAEKEKVNYEIVANKLSHLEELISGKEFKEFWDTVRDVNNYIRTLDYVSREHKAEFKAKIDDLCQEAKTGQQTEHEERSYQQKQSSATVKNSILQLVKEAVSFSISPEGLQNSMQKLDEVQMYLRSGRPIGDTSEMITSPSYPMTREDREECWEKFKAAKEEVQERRGKLKKKNFETIKDRLRNLTTHILTGDPYDALDAIKSARAHKNELLLDKEHHDELNSILDGHWAQAIERINLKRQEKAEKHLQWKRDMQDKIRHFESVIIRNNEYIERIQVQIEELEDSLATTHSTMHQERVQGWIEEKLQKIKDILRTNEEMEGKIADITMKLSE